MPMPFRDAPPTLTEAQRAEQGERAASLAGRYGAEMLDHA